MFVVEPSRLEIRVGRPADLDRVLEFFERTAYAPEPRDEVTAALTPPEPFAPATAQREIQIYLRILRRIHPDIDVHIVD